jgi:tRNA A-37 threonylcarbamoyl transferase component Bud32
MSRRAAELEEIVSHALEIESPHERDVYLNEACGGDPSLRAQVDGLLLAHDNARDVLESPTISAFPDDDRYEPVDDPGPIVGPYKLLHVIGAGGMGVVYMAEQTQPVRRRVALKIIQPGMDSRQVTARFEAERQALALMEHPNIAKVFDAGTTERGRPYFVMELVKGTPITKYCDDVGLTPRERLELFVPVCHAIQHAHQRGIIHRDVKPSNVMATLHDVKPVPKIIDFGVEGDRPAAHRADPLHPVRSDHRHARVHEPRAGRALGPWEGTIIGRT